MKIVTREAFLKIEDEVLYSKYHPCIFEGFEIKLENCGKNDWVADPIDPGAIKNASSDELFDLLLKAGDDAESSNPINLPMDFEYSGRDGCYEDSKSLIAVYDEADVLALVERLVKLLPNHKLVKNDE